MILVNNAGDWGKTFAQLLHAPWHGWTATDLVFPLFLFCLGVAIPYALDKRLERSGGRRAELVGQIARRTLILLALGFFLNWVPFIDVEWQRARIPGVLQRIALVYLVAALAYLYLRVRGRAVLSTACLAGYWMVMKLIPVPGFGAGDLSPEGNLAAHVDALVLGPHVWRWAPGPADPEGILSTVPAVATALIGVFAGEYLRSERPVKQKLHGLIAGGILCIVSGLVASRWLPGRPVSAAVPGVRPASLRGRRGDADL